MERTGTGQRQFRPLLVRLFAKIEAPKHPDGTLDVGPCWNWTGAYSTGKRGSPRPVIQLGARGSPVVHALRIMLSLADGVPLDERAGQHAAHACDNPRCVNPYAGHGHWATPTGNHEERMARQPESFQRRERRTG